MAGTYTKPKAAKHKVYFQDTEISRLTLKNGTLRQRLDPVRYPRPGKTGTAKHGKN